MRQIKQTGVSNPPGEKAPKDQQGQVQSQGFSEAAATDIRTSEIDMKDI